MYSWRKTEFEESVEMSTYLVALIVSDFKCIKSVAQPALSHHVDVSVCSRPEAVNQLNYALNVSTRILEFFESFYNIEYPLPKAGTLLSNCLLSFSSLIISLVRSRGHTRFFCWR